MRRVGDAVVYFAGDTDLFAAITALGPFRPRPAPHLGLGTDALRPGHLDPTLGGRADRLLQPELVVPIHWGTYSPIGAATARVARHPADHFRAALAPGGAGGVLRGAYPGGVADAGGPPLRRAAAVAFPRGRVVTKRPSASVRRLERPGPAV